MTLYLKYRPQTVEELGLTEVRENLQKILTSKEIPHAWLLTGTRGTGKTSAARIIAKFMNCEGKKKKPCNECEMCREITEGRAVDVVEIDAASNRGIDEIRALKERVSLAPMRAKYKVYIVDEAHMLTTEAENALLKTLEEPPANTLFILCTTEEGKLLDTVISRCTRIQFKKPVIAEIVNKLLRVAEGEKFKLTNEEAEKLAKLARGSFRDAIKLLEQAIMAGNTLEILKNTSSSGAETLLELILDNKQQEALDMIEKMTESGVNNRLFIEQLTELLHENLLKTKEVKFIRLIEGLEKAYERTKVAVVPQLPLEVWVIENTDLGNPKSKETITKPVQILNIQESNNPVTSPQKYVKSGKHAKFSLEDLHGKWGEILKKVKPMNHSVEALLRSTRPIDFDGEKLTLEVFYQFHYDKLNTDKCRQIVEISVGEVFSNPPAKLFMKLGQKEKNTQEEVTAKGIDEEVITAAEAIFNAQAV